MKRTELDELMFEIILSNFRGIDDLRLRPIIVAETVWRHNGQIRASFAEVDE